jgi:hypothetical protein
MRLIDADALKNTIKNMPNDYYGDLCIGDALKEIDNAPTIDAVPVVRCKDCKQYNTTGCSKGFGWCESMDRGVSDDFYCANGAKITNKETGETYK